MSGQSGIRSLAVAIYHRWEPHRLFLFMDASNLTAYIDESGTHDPSAYTVMGGLIGYATEWESFEAKWDNLLREQQLPYIHGKDLRAGRKAFADKTRWPPDKRRELANSAFRLALDHTLFGLTVVLRNEDYDTHYLRTGRKGRPAVASKYGVCAHVFIANAILLIQQLAPDAELHLVIEDGHRNSRAIRDIVNQWREDEPDGRARYISQDVTYVTKKDSPGVQAADLAVYLDYNLLRDDRANATPLTVRPGFILPAKSARLRVTVDRDTLTQLKRGEYLRSHYRRAMGRHWARVQGMPMGTSVQALASAPDEYLLVLPDSELQGVEDFPPAVKACFVHPRCQ
jgi:hypothetical protein